MWGQLMFLKYVTLRRLSGLAGNWKVASSSMGSEATEFSKGRVLQFMQNNGVHSPPVAGCMGFLFAVVC